MKAETMKFRRHPVFTICGVTLLTIYALALLLPLFWVLMSSFKSSFEFQNNVLGFPQHWTLRSYERGMDALRVPVGDGFVEFFSLIWNSLSYAFLYAICPLAGSVIVAYGCARHRSLWGKILYWTAIIIMIIPSIGGLSSSLVVSQMIGAYDNVLVAALWNIKPNGTTFLVCYTLFKGIDRAYSEAAFIDGAGNWRVFLTIIIPIGKNIIMVYFVTGLISYWNDWQTAMVWFPSFPTLSYALFRSQSAGNAGAQIVNIFACSVLVMIPVLILFIFIKDQLIGKISFGGIKG